MTPEQRKALDIGATCWVSASAGSGKTSLLVARIGHLLISGVSGRAILCVTFTKRAALEMQERLDHQAKRWESCSELVLKQELLNVIGHEACAQSMHRARILKSTLSKDPVVIQTFHSFCHDVLTRFPIESALNTPLQIWDQAKSMRIWEQSVASVLEEMDPHSDTGQAVTRVMASGLRIHAVLNDMFHQRMLPMPDHTQGDSPRDSEFSQDLFLQKHLNPMPEWGEMDDVDAAWIAKWQQHPRGSPEYRALILGKILKKESLRNGLLQDWHARECAYMQQMMAEQQQMEKIQTDHDRILIFQHVLQRYQNVKSGALDFDDLTIKTLDLLEHSAYAGWVSHTFYHELQHLLVDEAQDTSRYQWKILRYVIEAVMDNPTRTLCVVGDPKQSIYGFQGADPEGFFLMRQFAQAWVLSHGGRFYDVELTLSFRSAPCILNMVNAVFARQDTTRLPFTDHTSFHADRPGLVQLWPCTQVPSIELAAQWVKTISAWLKTPFFLPSQNRCLQPNDIMILLPRRTSFFHMIQNQLIQAELLARKDVSYGDDPILRLLVAWCRVVLYPDDDLALAELIEALSTLHQESWIFHAAYKRHRRSIWEHIQSLSESNPFFSTLVQYVQRVRQSRQSYRLLDLVIQWIYGEGGGAFLEQWGGAGAQQSIDVFIQAWQQWHDPDDAVGFLEWIHRDDTVFKGTHQDGVQLLTIHGAKGAQAPVVILPDLPAALEKEDPEYWRLLYVAMTRAQDRLYMSARKDTSPWYQVMVKSMHDVPIQHSTDGMGRIQWTHSRTPFQIDAGGSISTSIERISHAPTALFPDWLGPVAEPREDGDTDRDTFTALIRCVRDPHGPEIEMPPIQKKDTRNQQPEMTLHSYMYRHHGSALHQLLEELPTQPSERWWVQSVSFLKKQGMMDAHAQRWAHQLIALLNRPDLKPLFFQARAEVEWCSSYERRRMDRVLVRSNDVWIVDFKSDNRQPMTWADSPYVLQMQRYADVMSQIYPEKRIHQGILWLKKGFLQWHPNAQCWTF